MKVIAEVLEQVSESFQTKRGMKEITLLVCLDRGPGAALRNTFDYEMTEDECAKHSGKLSGKTIEIGIRASMRGMHVDINISLCYFKRHGRSSARLTRRGGAHAAAVARPRQYRSLLRH